MQPAAPKKVYYKYINDTVENNMPPTVVGAMMVRLRREFAAAQLAGETVADLKGRLRRANPDIDQFAREHPRFFDNILSAYTTPQDLEMMETMIRMKEAVNQGALKEDFAKALLSDLLIKHHALPAGVNTEQVCDRRLERKAEEGSFLGFDAQDIPHLREYADRAHPHRVVNLSDLPAADLSDI